MLTTRRDALQNAPLRTAAMREADNKKRHARWPQVRLPSHRISFRLPRSFRGVDLNAHSGSQTTIRIKFSDRSMLEKTFPSTDKIRSVYAFVRGSLREDVKPIKFVLCEYPAWPACNILLVPRSWCTDAHLPLEKINPRRNASTRSPTPKSAISPL